MIFTEARFFVFLALVWMVHWVALRTAAKRKWWLLLSSYAFYAAWDWRFLGLIIASTLVDYFIGLEIPRGRLPARVLVSTSIAANLSMLGFFKYYGFFVASFADLMTLLGLPAHLPTLQIVLPVGISFYTFQTMSYTVDVYRGQLQPVRRLLDLALFVAFFPQLVAGPIVRAVEFLPQLQRPRRLADIAVRSLLVTFLIGFIKKAVVSDRIARVVDAVYAAPTEYASLAVQVAVVLYAIQIYCDFSGYSDMAIAVAGLLGFDLPRNFALPYFSVSIAEFWRRWHISLSTWLRDYLYIPLGGSRGGPLRTARNLAATMFLGGLWHGASWTFVCWGLLHGLGLALHRVFARDRLSLSGWPARMVAGSGAIATFAFVCLAWVLLRAPSFGAAGDVLAAALGFADGGSRQVSGVWMLVVVALPAEWAVDRWRARTPQPQRTIPGWCFAIAYGVTWALLLTLLPRSARPFIYFQF